jgi:predicted esterase
MRQLVWTPMFLWLAEATSVPAVTAVQYTDSPPHTQPAATTASQNPAVAVTTTDVLLAHWRLEQALGQHPLQENRRAELNRKFDQACLLFYKGMKGQAMEQINTLTWNVRGAWSTSAASAPPADQVAKELLAATRVQIDPRAFAVDSQTVPVAKVQSVRPISSESGDPVSFTFRLLRSTGTTAFEQLFTVATDPPTLLDATLEPRMLSPDWYTVELATESGERLVVGRWAVLPTALDRVQLLNLSRLDAARKTRPALARALTICESRNKALTVHPINSHLLAFLTNPAQLAEEVESELKLLEAGENPYMNRAGELWRTMAVGSPTTEVPFRLYVPAKRPASNWPLLIALHGGIGDENTFLNVYGDGALRRFADERGFIVATPSPIPFTGEIFDAMVNDLAVLYPIERNRIYLIGHSLGANIASGLANMRAKQLAAVCCIAGGTFPFTACAPTLVIAGFVDPIIPPEKISGAVESALSKQLPVELRMKENQGHTLIVRDVLSEALDWLFGHARQ